MYTEEKVLVHEKNITYKAQIGEHYKRKSCRCKPYATSHKNFVRSDSQQINIYNDKIAINQSFLLQVTIQDSYADSNYAF